MIKIIETPQFRSKSKISYEVKDDVLIVQMNGITEEFDFTGLPDGLAEGVYPEKLDINPIVSAEKIGDELTIVLIRFYDEIERGVFEIVEDQMEDK